MVIHKKQFKPWAESEPKEKLDVDNGFLMCPNHDKLFDKGYITFDDNGKIIIFDELPENDKELLNIDSRKHIELTEDNKKYLKFHRENVFKNKLKFQFAYNIGGSGVHIK